MRGPYTLKLDGEEIPAELLADERREQEWNASMLYRGARAVASRVSVEMEMAVTVVGNVGSGSKKQRVDAATFVGGRR